MHISKKETLQLLYNGHIGLATGPEVTACDVRVSDQRFTGNKGIQHARIQGMKKKNMLMPKSFASPSCSRLQIAVVSLNYF